MIILEILIVIYKNLIHISIILDISAIFTKNQGKLGLKRGNKKHRLKQANFLIYERKNTVLVFSDFHFKRPY
jgi:hypothetical protein